jgi:hypothetical protein
MSKKVEDSKPNGYTKRCRDCEKDIYLHRGPTGPWRAYEPAADPTGLEGEWVRHRCTAALQDAEIMHIIAPAGSKPADLVPRLKRLIKDFSALVEQAERPPEPVEPVEQQV